MMVKDKILFDLIRDYLTVHVVFLLFFLLREAESS